MANTTTEKSPLLGAVKIKEKAKYYNDLGYSYFLSEDYRKASQINPKLEGLAVYNTACIYAIQDKNRKAKELLQKAFELDKTLIEHAKTDPEIKHLV